jgi:Protein of unknown function (DUF1565)
MRLSTLVGVSVLAGFLAAPSFAVCPGVGSCPAHVGCPPEAKLVEPTDSIQSVIAGAPAEGLTVCVSPGTYIGRIDFLGKPIHLISSGGPAVTILDGGGSGPVVRFATGEGSKSILEGVTVQNGAVSGNGAGISIDNASPTIRNVVVRNNRAIGTSARGGGIAVFGAKSRPVITCSQLLDNDAEYSGGGLYSAYSADPYVRSSVIAGNNASYGGGIGVAFSGRLDLGWSEISNNAAIDGGGLHSGVAYGNVLARQVWFKGNFASDLGGAMWVPAGFAEVVNATFDGNLASGGGALAAGFGSLVSVSSSLFVRNTTTGGGAALIDWGGANTSLVNHYNGFFGNVGGHHANTYGSVGLLTLPSFGTSCCPTTAAEGVNAGIPDIHFNDSDGSRNDLGACGGGALSVFGPMN